MSSPPPRAWSRTLSGSRADRYARTWMDDVERGLAPSEPARPPPPRPSPPPSPTRLLTPSQEDVAYREIFGDHAPTARGFVEGARNVLGSSTGQGTLGLLGVAMAALLFPEIEGMVASAPRTRS